MTIENDSALVGASYELANAGYRPMPDPEEKSESENIDADSVSLRDAAVQRATPAADLIVRQYLDDRGRPAAADEAVTLSRASRDYANATAAEKLVAENKSSVALAARVDELRAEALANDPEAAEFYGFDPPEAKSEGEVETGKPSDSRVDPVVDGLDPELEKVLQHPQVRHAVEEQLGQVEQTRQSYLNGLAAATQIAQVSFLSQFPELATTPQDRLPAVLEQLSQQDPAKFARVRAMVATTEQLFAHQREESGRQAERGRRNFESYAHAEDARFETMLKGESKETQAAVTAQIMESAKESGVDGAEMNRLFNSEALMRNAVFQRMMYDAGKYRLMMKARIDASTRPLPPVQRPGVARVPAEREQTDLRTLNARLSNSGDIKDAVALYHARKSNRR